MQIGNLLPIAKIQYCLPDGQYRVNFKRDALLALSLPVSVFLCQNFDTSCQAKPLEFAEMLKQSKIEYPNKQSARIKVYHASLLAISNVKAERAHIDLGSPFLEEETSLKTPMETPLEATGKVMVTKYKSNLNSGDYEKSWICVAPSLLVGQNNAGEAYIFQLIGLPVYSQGNKVGFVIDYFENGAHGVLVVEDLEKSEVMLPYVSKHAHLADDLTHINAPQFANFL